MPNTNMKIPQLNVLGWVLGGFTICLVGIGITILSFPVSSEKDAVVVSNGIQFVSLAVGVITIYFVFATFQQQRSDSKRNERNTEFNRTLDIIYKQLEYTKATFNNKQRVEGINASILSHEWVDIFNVKFSIDAIMKDILLEFNFYKIVFDRVGLDANDKTFLFKIFYQNVPQVYKDFHLRPKR